MSDRVVQDIDDRADDRGHTGEEVAWASLLTSLCQLANATTAILATVDRLSRAVRVHCSVNIADRHLHAYTARYAAADPSIRLVGSLAAGTVWAAANTADDNLGIFFRDGWSRRASFTSSTP